MKERLTKHEKAVNLVRLLKMIQNNKNKTYKTDFFFQIKLSLLKSLPKNSDEVSPKRKPETSPEEVTETKFWRSPRAQS